MTEFKKNNYKFWHSPLVLFFFFFIFILFSYNIIGLIKKERETAHKKELILEEIDNLKYRENMLNNDISRLQTEDGKEEIIREKYQVAKSGEKMILIVDEKDDQNLLEDNGNINHGFLNWISTIFKK